MKSSTKGLKLLSYVTLINVLISLVYSIIGIFALLIVGDNSLNHNTFIFALYAMARTFPLTLLVLLAICKKWILALVSFGTLAGLIQFCDGLVGLFQNDLTKIFGPIFLGFLQFYSIYRFRKHNPLKPQ